MLPGDGDPASRSAGAACASSTIPDGAWASVARRRDRRPDRLGERRESAPPCGWRRAGARLGAGVGRDPTCAGWPKDQPGRPGRATRARPRRVGRRLTPPPTAEASAWSRPGGSRRLGRQLRRGPPSPGSLAVGPDRAPPPVSAPQGIAEVAGRVWSVHAGGCDQPDARSMKQVAEVTGLLTCRRCGKLANGDAAVRRGPVRSLSATRSTPRPGARCATPCASATPHRPARSVERRLVGPASSSPARTCDRSLRSPL